jgi:hypothetical protein
MVNSIFGRAYVYHNDKMYHVARIIRESHNPVVDVWKEHLMCDTVLKKEGNYYFCQAVQDMEVTEDEQI